MQLKKKQHPETKEKLHSKNKHRNRYDFKSLVEGCPELKSCIIVNKYNDETIDFSNPDSVKILNKALLKFYYGITDWDIPVNYLCPPVPGRADYIHHIAEMLGNSNKGKIPTGAKIKCLDVGVGANCIYPIIGSREYGWSFVGSDIDIVSINNAQKIIDINWGLGDLIELRQQPDNANIFKNIIQPNEKFDLTICNPPFHSSQAEAQAGNLRKVKNLTHKKVESLKLNFGGQSNELWCKGGEEAFVNTMIKESKMFSKQCFAFSTLVSKSSLLHTIYSTLENEGVYDVITLPMGQGNKISRVVAWTFLTIDEQTDWMKQRWA